MTLSASAVSEQIVHLRTPKETTVGKVMDSCIKLLGVMEDKSLFIMTEAHGAKISSSSCYALAVDTQHSLNSHVTCTFTGRVFGEASTRSADWESAEIRQQTTGAALAQSGETDHLTFILSRLDVKGQTRCLFIKM